MPSPIAISLSPNTEIDDVWRALRVMFSPWQWREGRSIAEIESWFCRYLSVSQVVSFNSGRSALLAILTAFGIGVGDEVLLQAFTCVAVPNSIRWAGATPIYVDIDDSYNIDPTLLEKKITKQTKAIIIQHTFGIPAQMEEIIAIARKYKLLVIEDCAHALGAMYKGKKVGTLGDAAFFSFGRDKVISSVFGGAAMIQPNYKKQNENLTVYERQLPYPSLFWIGQQLFHPIAFSVILPFYRIGLGKVFLVLLQKFRLLSFPVYAEEKRGRRPNDFPKRYPNGLALLLVSQLEKLERYNTNRKLVAGFYRKELGDKATVRLPPHREGAICFRFPLQVDRSIELLKKARQRGILLGNWYHGVIDPKGTQYETVGYAWGSCPNAHEAAEHIVNLPTRISLSDTQRVIQFLKQH